MRGMGHNLRMGKYFLWMAVILALTGCKKESGGSQNQDDSDQDPVFYNFQPDHTTHGGMEIDLNGYSPDPIEGSPEPAYIEGVDNWYEQTQQCVADWYAVLYPSVQFEFHDPPPIVISDDPESICGDLDAFFINGIYCTNFAIPIIVIRGGASYQTTLPWKHEFIHYFLDMNNFDQEMNLNHLPDEIWENCVL
jgi:hypothetical protein